jgi:hypothetical protein
MDLALNPDQIALVDAAGKLAASYKTVPANTRETLLVSEELNVRLKESGFRDVAKLDGMGPLDAVLIAEVVQALPFHVDYIAPALLSQALEIDIPGSVACLAAPDASARNLTPGSTALIVEGADVRVLDVTADMIAPIETPFAYPLGKLKSGARDGVVLHGAAAKMLRAWRQALAVEIGAAARAATELTVAFVNERRQFGKPIGAYQAVQHRLSECTTAVHAIEALVRRAAALGTDEAILAALTFAKENCTRIIYDTHQFQGAIGLTYEYPLHFYTYRLRLLHGELGGPQESAEALALERWRDEAPDWGA